MQKCGIYGIFSLDGKVLVGSTSRMVRRWIEHKTTARNGTHGNPYFQRSWNKYGEASFEFRILEECPSDMLIVRENSWMAYYKSTDPLYGYNLQNASRTFVSEEIRRKISEANKGRVHSEETKHKMSLAAMGLKRALGHKHSEESKMKMSLAIKQHIHKFGYHWTGRHHNPETIKKISEANKGRLISEEQRRKLRDSQTGRHMSEETKLKISKSLIGNKRTLGYKHSEETKAKISKSHMGNHVNLGSKHTDEHKRKIGSRSRDWWKNMSEEQRQKISEMRKNIWKLRKEKKEAALQFAG